MTNKVVTTDKEYAITNLGIAMDSARCIVASDKDSKEKLKYCLKQMQDVKLMLKSVME